MPYLYRMEEIFNKCQFRGSLVGTENFDLIMPVFSHISNQVTPLEINNIPSQQLGTNVFLRIEKIVDNAANFGQEIKDEITERLWSAYNLRCENTQNPIEEHTERNKELNFEYYGMYTKEDVLAKTTLSSMLVTFDIDDLEDSSIYTSIYFQADWIGDGFIEYLLLDQTIEEEFIQ